MCSSLWWMLLTCSAPDVNIIGVCSRLHWWCDVSFWNASSTWWHWYSFISLFSLHLEKHLVNLLDDVDHSFFDRIKMNSEHVHQPYLPERPEICYSLRQRSHNKTLLTKTAYLNDQDYLIQMLYKDWLLLIVPIHIINIYYKISISPLTP